MENQSDSDSEDEYYETCDHEYTIKSLGWKICLTCGLCLKRCFSTDDYYKDRVFIKNRSLDKVKEVRDKMNELISVIVREFHTEARPPYELYDYEKELCYECYNYALPNNNVWKKRKHKSPFSPIRCHIRSLCAAVLWEKVKSLYPMTITEFTKKLVCRDQRLSTRVKKNETDRL